LGYKVLVVEDSAMMRELIASTCESIGSIAVTESASGFEALKVLPREHFDLIITDINMPDINGLELIRFVKSHKAYATTPLFIVSTESSQTDLERGLKLGANEYLPKPFQPAHLDALVRRYLRISE
jgi:two-component system chemotaxis response regulator CheY